MRLTPVQYLLGGFILLILIGTALLSLPTASAGSQCHPFLVALFTATSAVTTTGLVVVDTGSAFSGFGQTVILVLFQVGGLGYMIVIAAAVLGVGGRLSLFERMLLRESLQRPASMALIRFIKLILTFTLVFEAIGVICLAFVLARDLPPLKAIYAAVFHATSAFCTAGFSLFADGFSRYGDSLLFNGVVMGLCLGGASGFFVLYEVFSVWIHRDKRDLPYRWSVHTRLSLCVSLGLIMIGTTFMLLWEPSCVSSTSDGRILRASFQSLSAATTTGFNTVSISELGPGSLFLLICLMFVGASSGGTGGGIKGTSLGVMLLSLAALLTGKEEVTLFGRRIPTLTVYRAFIIGLIAILWITAVTLILALTEDLPFLGLFFEVVSAFGTVGLSTGVTPVLSDFGKILLCMTMLVGRIGPLAIGYSLMGRRRAKHFSYPETEILVG